MNTRERFVARFGEPQADAIESAAECHANGINSENKGSDEFRWALLICIGYQCAEVEGYRKDHGITVDFAAFEQFCMDDGGFKNHDGDSDYLSLMIGRYNKYVGVADFGK